MANAFRWTEADTSDRLRRTLYLATMKNVSAADVVELAAGFRRGDKSREDVSREAQEIISADDTGAARVDDDAFELLSYLTQFDVTVPQGRYLWTDEEIHEELAKLGVK